MTDDRLNGLAILSVESALTAGIRTLTTLPVRPPDEMHVDVYFIVL